MKCTSIHLLHDHIGLKPITWQIGVETWRNDSYWLTLKSHLTYMMRHGLHFHFMLYNLLIRIKISQWSISYKINTSLNLNLNDITYLIVLIMRLYCHPTTSDFQVYMSTHSFIVRLFQTKSIRNDAKHFRRNNTISKF